tara:strand:+ start:301 stop:402 length:102 start_codon:yes stop_codon:yes gene_type:complete
MIFGSFHQGKALQQLGLNKLSIINFGIQETSAG